MVNRVESAVNKTNVRDVYSQLFAVHIAIDVAILDKSLPYADPTLYELNTSAATPDNPQVFLLLGKVVSIDTHAKVIHLDDLNVITYQHLLIVSGPQIDWMHPVPNKEFAAGVKLLMNALKLQNKKPTAALLRKKKKTVWTKLKKNRSNFPRPLTLRKKPAVKGYSRRVYQIQL